MASPKDYKVVQVHLINQDSIIQMHVFNIRPCYIGVVIGACLQTMRVKFLLIDMHIQQIVFTKEFTLPFSSAYKIYFQEPYLCVLLGKARLMVLNVRDALSAALKRNARLGQGQQKGGDNGSDGGGGEQEEF